MAKGKDIFNYFSKVVLKGTSGNDTITNYLYDADSGHYLQAKNVTIYGGKGNDLITNDGSDFSGGYDSRGANTKIYGEAGNDTINNIGGNSSTIDGGAGNDSISNSGNNVKIYGGKGNDSIYSSIDGNFEGEDGVTIAGGAGNDYINIAGDAENYTYGATNAVIQYSEGDGNDTIVGFNDDDTLQITSGTPVIIKSGNNLVVKVGESSILIKDALVGGYEKIHLQDSFGNPITYNDWKVWNGSIENNLYDNVTLAGSSKDDTIGNSGKNVLITGQAGNDSISNSGENVTITGGKGKDYISLDSYDKSHLIQYASGDGNDTIVGFNDDDTLQITSGKYSVDTIGNNFIVKVGDSTITIKLDDCSEKIHIQNKWGEVVTYNDDWTVWNGSIANNSKSDVTLAGSSEDDVIIGNIGENVLITGQAGDDSISNGREENWDNSYGSNSTIDGGAGNDSITNISKNVTISGGAGNDSITNGGDYTTITGGAGNDYIALHSQSYYGSVNNNLIQYAEGDGNDTIVGFDDDDTLKITSGSYTVDTVGNDFVVTVGENTVVFKLADGSEKINLADSLGNVTTYDNNWTVWNGSIENNSKDKVTLAGSSEDDTIGNSGENVLITGQDGNDSISNSGNNATIDGGKGNDTITNSGSSVTITGGKGNDYISIATRAKKNIIQYASGDGKDTVVGFNANDTLKITSGTYSAKASGDDVIVTVGKGSIRLKDAAKKKISIANASGNVTTKKYSSSSALFAENNFVTADNLSEIVAEKSVGEIKFTKPEKISQENLIAYANK